MVACWGDNTYGQVSDTPSWPGFVDVTPGLHGTCAVHGAGAIECWGLPKGGRAAIMLTGSYTDVAVLMANTGAGGFNNFADLCATTAGDGVHCIARDSTALVDDAPDTGGRTQVVMSIIGAPATGYGQGTACALDDLAQVACWGE